MPSTQYLLPIKEVKGGVIIDKFGNFKGILAASSVNFALMRPEEQQATVFQFQNFLNSLDFPIQILVQSRKLNLLPYIEYLKELELKQETELLRIQAQNYREFIESLSQMVNLMTKYFYIVISFRPTTIAKTLSEKEFERAKEQLYQRLYFVQNGLARCGIKCKILEDEEILELLWMSFNPSEAEKGKIPRFPVV